MGLKNKNKLIAQESDSESINSSDEELQEAFAEGLLKPGINAAIELKKQPINCVGLLKEKLNEFKLNLPWIERLDITIPRLTTTHLTPEQVLEIQDLKHKRKEEMRGKKLTYDSNKDPAIDDFTRENIFRRQAQTGLTEGLARLKKLGIPVIRPDDYFAEMVKSDEHMQKVRQHIMKMKLITERKEKAKKLREQKKIAKQVQVEAIEKKHQEKRHMLEEIKKYRKGVRKDLNFLDDKKISRTQRKSQSEQNYKTKLKAKKYGFGGKKRNSKWNTKSSSADVSEYNESRKLGENKRRIKNAKKGGKGNQRLGKSRRIKMKEKKK